MESELYYYNARYYNPKLGRFISRDTALGKDGDSLSRNLYIYVKNNPLKYVDPSGEYGEEVHFYAVYYLARTAGITEESARKMANYSQYVDISASTAPIESGFKAIFLGCGTCFDTLRRMHFYRDNLWQNGSVVHRNPDSLRDLISSSLAENDFAEAGMLLHTYADTWSHEGYDWWHGLSSAPDDPLRNEDNKKKVFEAAQNIFDIFSQYTGSSNALDLKEVKKLLINPSSVLSNTVYSEKGLWNIGFSQTNVSDTKFAEKLAEINAQMDQIISADRQKFEQRQARNLSYYGNYSSPIGLVY